MNLKQFDARQATGSAAALGGLAILIGVAVTMCNEETKPPPPEPTAEQQAETLKRLQEAMAADYLARQTPASKTPDRRQNAHPATDPGAQTAPMTSAPPASDGVMQHTPAATR